MSYSINPALWNKVFPIPLAITDKHIKMCSGVALKCLLLILRSPDEFCNIEQLAAKLGQSPCEIADALNYWYEQGVLSSIAEGEAPAFKKAESAPQKLPAQMPQNTAVAQTNAQSSSRPHFQREEALGLVESDSTLQSLMQELQAVLSKPLTSADIDVLIALYSFYGLSAHYILSLVHYCVTIGKKGMAYAEKVAATWIADGIDDSLLDKHIDKLMKRRTNEGRIQKEFGLSDRSLTNREKEYIAAWFDTLGLDMPLIMLAYEITVNRTGKAAFGYLNKILLDWNQKSVKTIEDAKKESTRTKSNGEAPIQSDLDRKILEQFMKN